MPAVKKRRHPANDHRPLSSHRMSYVVLPRPYWTGKRIAAACLLGLFAVALAAIWIPVHPEPIPEIIVSTPAEGTPAPVLAAAPSPPAQPPTQPYDITLNASALDPQNGLDALAAALPAQAVQPLAAHSVPPAHEDLSPEEDVPGGKTAAGQAALARNLEAAGDLRQALKAQHRAAELDPDNMLYRLQLAVLYDRAGHGAGAALLYRQVVQAYERHDGTLPRTVGIDGIRRRAEYLASMDPQ